MANHIWKSKDSQIISKYAERLEPAEGEKEEESAEEGQIVAVSPQRKSSRPDVDGIDFRYMNGLPPKDLLNYKNMDLEMSLWAKTPTGWLSVAVMVAMALTCFVLTWILWLVHG